MILSNECWMKTQCKKALVGSCPEEAFCIKLFKMNALYDNALISNVQRRRIGLRYDANGVDQAEFQRLAAIQNDIESNVKNGMNLYIHSVTCGNGKTSWALRMIQAYFEAIWHKSDIQCKALFINVPRFMLAIKDNITERSDYVEHIKRNIANADLVVWDDIGTKTVTQFEAENLLSMLDMRINAGKANIFTSNMSENELYEVLGQRLASRVVNLSENVELHGVDKRVLVGGGK